MKSISCDSIPLAPQLDSQDTSQPLRRRMQSRRVVVRCRWVGRARAKQANLRYRRHANVMRLRRLYYWSLGRLPRQRPKAQSSEDFTTCGNDFGPDLKTHDAQDLSQDPGLGTLMREILQPVLNSLLCIGWNPYLAVRRGLKSWPQGWRFRAHG